MSKLTVIKGTTKFAEEVSFLLTGAAMLVAVCEAVQLAEDKGQAIPEALKENFDFAMLQQQMGVDKAIDFKEATEGFIDRCKFLVARIENEKALAQDVLEVFKSLVKDCVEQNPDIPFKGFKGGIGVQKSAPAMKTAMEPKHLTADMIRAFNIPDKYIKAEYHLDTAMIKADLQAGLKLPWAWLEHGHHVRFKK